jgi:aldehyde:ferredoxin oxidoreductase
MFNIREIKGKPRKLDSLPRRFFTKVPSGWKKGKTILTRKRFNTLLDRYYELRGWDRYGVPTKGKLNDLGLSLD